MAVRSAKSFWDARGPTRCVPAGIMRFATSSSFSFWLLRIGWAWQEDELADLLSYIGSITGVPLPYIGTVTLLACGHKSNTQMPWQPCVYMCPCMGYLGVPSRKACSSAVSKDRGQPSRGRALAGVHVVGHEGAQGGVRADDGVRLPRGDVCHVAQRVEPGLSRARAQRVARERRAHAARALAAAAELVQVGILHARAGDIRLGFGLHSELLLMQMKHFILHPHNVSMLAPNSAPTNECIGQQRVLRCRIKPGGTPICACRP